MSSSTSLKIPRNHSFTTPDHPSQLTRYKLNLLVPPHKIFQIPAPKTVPFSSRHKIFISPWSPAFPRRNARACRFCARGGRNRGVDGRRKGGSGSGDICWNIAPEDGRIGNAGNSNQRACSLNGDERWWNRRRLKGESAARNADTGGF